MKNTYKLEQPENTPFMKIFIYDSTGTEIFNTIVYAEKSNIEWYLKKYECI